METIDNSVIENARARNELKCLEFDSDNRPYIEYQEVVRRDMEVLISILKAVNPNDVLKVSATNKLLELMKELKAHRYTKVCPHCNATID